MNNKKIISKCIIELKKTKFNKQYVLGMLEALLFLGEKPYLETKEKGGEVITNNNPVVMPNKIENTGIPKDAINVSILKNPNVDVSPHNKSSSWK